MNIPSLRTFLVSVTLLLPIAPLGAEPVPVRHPEGTVHGLLVLHTLAGKALASGDMIQIIREEHVLSHLIFRFKDGSVDDETSVFSQHGQFRLISDHHVQKGPSFPHPLDVSIDVHSGEVTVRSIEKGKERVEKMHFDLPPDLANGIVLDVLKNIPPERRETRVAYLVADPKPRLVTLLVAPQQEEAFSVGGIRHTALRFRIKVELGGITGIVAPLIGKEPSPLSVWIIGGEAPDFVKLEGQLYLGGPVWDIEEATPVWPGR